MGRLRKLNELPLELLVAGDIDEAGHDTDDILGLTQLRLECSFSGKLVIGLINSLSS